MAPFHKWLPIISSFINIKITLANLFFESKIKRNFYFQSLVRPALKIIINWQAFMKRIYLPCQNSGNTPAISGQ